MRGRGIMGVVLRMRSRLPGMSTTRRRFGGFSSTLAQARRCYLAILLLHNAFATGCT